MARQSRIRRNREDMQQGAPASPYISRRLPYFDPLDEETLVTLEARVDWFFQEHGIEFREDPEALRIWKEGGADVQGTRVRAPADLIRALCAKAPREFTQIARNPARSVRIGGDNQVFAPI